MGATVGATTDDAAPIYSNTSRLQRQVDCTPLNRTGVTSGWSLSTTNRRGAVNGLRHWTETGADVASAAPATASDCVESSQRCTEDAPGATSGCGCSW